MACNSSVVDGRAFFMSSQAGLSQSSLSNRPPDFLVLENEKDIFLLKALIVKSNRQELMERKVHPQSFVDDADEKTSQKER